jgi:Cdc6-like AAA superfamily ATPase
MPALPLPPDPGVIYGRAAEVEQLTSRLDTPIDGAQALLLTGAGGTGKTYLLQEMQRALERRGAPFLPLYDFYHIDNFKPGAIEQAIAALDPPVFEPYHQQTRKLEASRQSGAQFEVEHRKLRASFVDCFNAYANTERERGRSVVLLFDSAEQAVDLSDRAAERLPGAASTGCAKRCPSLRTPWP